MRVKGSLKLLFSLTHEYGKKKGKEPKSRLKAV